MKTDAEIRQAGMRALIQSLGAVEAERFVASLSKDRFDYTEWRRAGLLETDIEALSATAAEYSRHSTIDRRSTRLGCIAMFEDCGMRRTLAQDRSSRGRFTTMQNHAGRRSNH